MTPPEPGTARYIIALSLMHSLPNTTVGETRDAIEHVHAALVRHGFLAPEEADEADRLRAALCFILDACGAAIEEHNGQLWVSYATGEYGHFVTPENEHLARFVAALAPDEVNEAET